MKIQRAHACAYLTKLQCGGWYLDSITVEESYRNHGKGTALMKIILSKCEKPIYLLATSELGGDTYRLVDFYKKFGFVSEKQEKNSAVPFNYNMVIR